ncbi:hypothetical protein KIM372_06160 [Bombiscardovia nodaiensis]|uniref:Ig-like domain-containing protein n=1 Tax=Bombiscardovia nodaiensis TaxID=2932181 RepID=A0ABM8B765_9BIFI|nr:hypothetical protein KIM372_06160 [Bombiscardovia nodaiensis]
MTYDNNSVRNGKYYKANRAAHVSLVSTSFDFVQANDERRVVVTTVADGSERTVLAKDFKNPSGDGKTWLADVACDHDADWSLQTSFTDQAGHSAPAYRSDFTIDTVKPFLNLSFDNNKASSGSYYNAPRLASVTELERNFSPGESSIIVTATDAGGAPVGSPAPSAWADTGKRYEHGSTVSFGQELHYKLLIQATDLAGNTAQEVQEPEFVVDLTKPQVRISQVADKTAYAGKVTPHIEFADTNFEPALAQYELTRTRDPYGQKAQKEGGAAKEEPKKERHSVYLKAQEQKGTNTRSISLPDLEHTVDNDDVYTLKATIEDKAGNKAESQVVFSLNRFGSNYVIDEGTRALLGEYVHKPPVVKVSEINVSGLQTDKSHVEVVHDAAVRSVNPGSDYQAVNADDTGWQKTDYVFPSQLFADEGYYRLRMTSTDLAGNLSQNTMAGKDHERKGTAEVNFAVDRVPPSASVVGLRDHLVVYQPVRQLVVNAKDDLAVASVQLRIDGQTVGSWQESQTLEPMTYRLLADGQAHDIDLTVVDKAGNTSRVSYTAVVVTSSRWAYYMAQGLLLPGIAASIVLLALIMLATVLSIRHHRKVAYRRNVFMR